MSPRIALAVPCFNEAARLDVAALRRALASQPDLDLVLVDDGSRDGTSGVLERVREGLESRVEVLRFGRNAGKGEAVRRGLLRALERGAGYVGFWDADLSTPLAELPAFRAVLDASPRLEMVLGARVQLLGRRIERRALRHYPGRVFATLVSWTLGLAVYDTQCGAKLFRVTPELRAILAEPFASRWVFDVEMLARRIARRSAAGTPPVDAIYELPLAHWRDVPGSKLRPLDGVRALRDLARIALRLRRSPRAGL